MTSTECTTRIPTRGKVLRADGTTVVFAPVNTNYELHLVPVAEKFTGPIDQPIDALIRVRARKVYTVSSGGNFIQPIFGPPRVIQGRVISLDEQRVVLRAGALIIVELPSDKSAIDLNRGPIAQGSIVNVIALPGATVEFPSPTA